MLRKRLDSPSANKPTGNAPTQNKKGRERSRPLSQSLFEQR